MSSPVFGSVSGPLKDTGLSYNARANPCPFLIIGKIPSLDTIQQLGFVLGLCYFFHILFPRLSLRLIGLRPKLIQSVEQVQPEADQPQPKADPPQEDSAEAEKTGNRGLRLCVTKSQKQQTVRRVHSQAAVGEVEGA
jgi:hypothetical protein